MKRGVKTAAAECVSCVPQPPFCNVTVVCWDTWSKKKKKTHKHCKSKKLLIKGSTLRQWNALIISSHIWHNTGFPWKHLYAQQKTQKRETNCNWCPHQSESRFQQWRRRLMKRHSDWSKEVGVGFKFKGLSKTSAAVTVHTGPPLLLLLFLAHSTTTTQCTPFHKHA